MDFLKLLDPEQNKGEYEQRLKEVQIELAELEEEIRKDKTLAELYEDELFNLNLEKQTLEEIIHDLSDEPKEKLERYVIWSGSIGGPTELSAGKYLESIKELASLTSATYTISESEIIIIGTKLSKMIYEELMKNNESLRRIFEPEANNNKFQYSSSQKELLTESQKKQNLISHVSKICKILNERGLRNSHRVSVTGKIFYFDWEVCEENPSSTFVGGIYPNEDAFGYLKNNGYIDINICWMCGDEPISNQYKFSLTTPNKGFSICKSCYERGKP